MLKFSLPKISSMKPDQSISENVTSQSVTSQSGVSEPVATCEDAVSVDLLGDQPPEFGLVDVIEAFTAMRHEWRGQTKESRELVLLVQSASAHLQDIETKRTGQTASDNDKAKQLATLIADIDSQLTRAVGCVIQADANRRECERFDWKAIEDCFQAMNPIARRFARPLMSLIHNQHSGQATTADPSMEGMNLLIARLRRLMKDHRIERLDTLGQLFDAELMNAIDRVESQKYPDGHVAEQLSPAYRWQGTLLRFADVRVASS